MICYESRPGRHYIGGKFVTNDGRDGNYLMISDRWLHGAKIEEDGKILKLFYSSISKDRKVKKTKTKRKDTIKCLQYEILMPRIYEEYMSELERLNLTISEALEANGATHTLPDKNRKSPGKPVGNILCRIMVRARLRRLQNGIYDQFEPILNLLKK